MSLPSQVPTAPETRPATPVSQVEAQDEGLWMKGMIKSDGKKEPSGSVLSTPLHRGHGISSNEPSVAAPSDVTKAPFHKISRPEIFEEAPAELASSIHELDIGSGQIYKPHTDANPDLGDLIPGQSSGPYSNTSTSPLGIWDTSKDVPASSLLEMWTEEDLLKFGIHEGMDVNHGLPPFDENVREYHTEKTASNKGKSDDGIHDSSTPKPSASSVALGNRTESYGGINVTFGLPPWIETKFSETGETLEKNSNQYHLGAPFVQVSGLYPTPPRKDTDCKALRSVSLSAVGTPTVAESRTLPLAETKDTAATGDTDINSPCSRKIPSASERPESPFALRDVSVIPWTDCYPDDPDKARELATSTGVPGLQIYSVDIFTHATSDTQVLDEVDATQDSDNFRVEMGKQISPERPSVPGTKKPYDKFETKSSAETWDTDVDFDLNEGSRKMTEEDLRRLDLQSWWKEDLSDVTTGLPLISKEDLPGLENVCKESLFSVGGPAAEDSGENVAEKKTGIDRGHRRPPTANASSFLEMKVDPSIDVFGTTNRQESPGYTLPSVSSDWQPPKATQESQHNDSVRASSVTDSEGADGSGWVKVEIETGNLGQTDNV